MSVIAKWGLPEIWKDELENLVNHFSTLYVEKSKKDVQNFQNAWAVKLSTLENISIIPISNATTIKSTDKRIFLFSDFSSNNINDIIDEALNYLHKTLIDGYCDIIYPNWGDTSFDLLQLIVAMQDKTGKYPIILPRHNNWPLRGKFSVLIKERCLVLGKLNCNVLITGPSGCGKEAIARLIHHASGCKGEFISISVPAIPKELFQSFLFGHEKGAFTGASSLQAGAFEKASDGTLFLDEVADIEPEQQAALLRVLSERKANSIGGTRNYPITCRIISATNRLDKLRSDFRDDLRIRLSEQEISHTTEHEDWQPIKSLEFIREHIPLLFAMQYVKCFREQLGYDIRVPSFKLTVANQDMKDSTSILRLLTELEWPMNFRQLQQISLHALMRYLGELPCMKLLFPDDSLLKKILRENELQILIKPKSKNTFSLSKSNELSEDIIRKLIFNENLGKGKRWDKIAWWIRKQVIEYLRNKENFRDAQIARLLDIDRSCISRFQENP